MQHQNPDGGFGETPDSYYDTRLAGCGPSQCVITGKVITALVAQDYHNSDVVSRGLEYLLENESDGCWPSDFPIGVVMPPTNLYTNPWYSLFTPLEALISWHNKRA